MYAIDLVLMASPVRVKPKDSSPKAACHLRYLTLSTSAVENQPARCSWHSVHPEVGTNRINWCTQKIAEASRFRERTKRDAALTYKGLLVCYGGIFF